MRTRRSWPWLAVALLVGIAAGAGLLWSRRAAVVETLALRLLAARAIPATLRVVRFDLAGLELADLSVGEAGAPDLGVARTDLAWSWRSLRERRLERVELRGVRLRARLGAAGFELGALDALRHGSAGAGSAPRGLPFAEAQLRDVEVALESAEGPVLLRAEGRAATSDPRSREVTGTAELSGTAPWGRGTASLRLSGTLDAPRVDFSGQAMPDQSALGLRATDPVTVEGSAAWDPAGAPSANARIGAKRLEIPAVAQLTGVAVAAKLAGEAVTASVRVGKLVELSDPALVAPLAIEAELDGTLGRLGFHGVARTGADGIALPFDGTLERRPPRLKLAIRLPDTDLAASSHQPARLFPRLGNLVRRAKGHVAAEAAASYADGKLSASARIAFEDVDLRTEYATLRRLNGLVTVTGPSPLATPPGQTLSVALIEGPLPLSDGIVSFELLPQGTLRIERGVFRLAGGTLSLTGSLPLSAEERELVLTAKQLSVEQILAALGFEGLSGTGFLDGTLPLSQRGRQVRVVAGELRATEPGFIRYAGGEGAARLAVEQPQLASALGALENLRYETLTLEVSGDTSGELDVKVHARGSNPNFQQGRPVILNLNVEAPVASLLRAGFAAYRVPEEIEGQVKRFFDRGRK